MSENENTRKKQKTVLGFVLLSDANLDYPRFRHNLKEDWGISFSDEVKDGAVVFRVDDYNCACSIMPTPIPNGEAEACARNNLLWKEAPEVVSKHAAHVMIAVMDTDENEYYDPVDANALFCKLASSMCKLNNAIAVYKNPTVFEKKFYVEVAENLKQNNLPIPIMLHVGMYMTQDKLLNGFTYGLKAYGKEEFEVLHSKAQPAQLYNFLLALSDYVINGDFNFKDGDTVGFTDDQHMSITFSKAAAFEGNSLKVDFMS